MKDQNDNLIAVGDTVHHEPTGEDWVVRRVGIDSDGGFVEPAGWPPCRARASDCTVLKKAGGLRFLHQIEQEVEIQL